MERNTEIVPVELTDGTIIQVVVTGIASEEEIGIGRFSFSDLRTSVESIAREMTGVLESVSPSKATVEFGLEVAVESGKLTALLVQGSGTATLKITLEWTGSPSTRETK